MVAPDEPLVRRRHPPPAQHIITTPGVFWAVLALSFLPALLWVVDASVVALEAPLRGRLARWKTVEPHHYRYTIAVRCFCLAPADRSQTVEVRDGKIVSATATYRGRTMDLPLQYSVRITDVFDALISAASLRAKRIEADYDPRLGFPTRVWIDPVIDAYDDELGVTITDFRVLR